MALSFFCSNAQTVFAEKKKKEKLTEAATTAKPALTKKDVATQGIFILGMQAYILGNTQDAVTKFNEVLRLDPKNHAALYVLSKIAFESGNMDKSIEYAQNAVKLDPTNEYYYQYLAEAKAEKNDFEGAAKVYEQIVKLRPRDYDYYYDWAYMLSKAGKYKEALEAYTILEQKTGVSEELIFQKQPLWMKLGKVDECVADVEKLIKLYPEDMRYVGLIGEIYEANKQYDKAIQTYQRLLSNDPNNAYAMLGIAEMYRKKGNNALKDEWTQKVFNNTQIDIDTKILTIIPYIEKLSRDSTLSRDVMKMADKLVELHPNEVKAVTARADVLYNIGKKKEAQAEYIKAISMSDVPPTVWIQLYILNTELEDYDSLIKYSELGMRKNPNDLFGYFYNAIANQQKKNLKAASDVLTKAFELQNSGRDVNVQTPQLTLQMLITLGDISFELKNYDRSDSSYEAALEIDPNNATVLNNYAYYLSERNIKLEKAERMSKKSNLLVDNNSAFIDTYAWIMYKMKNYSEALEWIEQAMQLPDANERAELLSHYGDILFKSGQTQKAIEQWKRAIEKGGDKEELESKIKAGI